MRSRLPTKEEGNQKWYLVTEPIEVFALIRKAVTSATIIKTCKIIDQKDLEIIYNERMYSKKEDRNWQGAYNAYTTILERRDGGLDKDYFVSRNFLNSVKIMKSEEIRYRLRDLPEKTSIFMSGLDVEGKKLLALSCFPPFDFSKPDKDKDDPKEIVIALDHHTCSPI